MRKTRPLIGCALALVALTLAACNTVEGFGEDLEEAGKAIQGE